MSFEFFYKEKLTSEKIESGWLELAYIGFYEMTLDRRTKSLKLIGDCGNIWFCTVIFRTRQYAHLKIGGGWKRMTLARRFHQELCIVVGAPEAGETRLFILE